MHTAKQPRAKSATSLNQKPPPSKPQAAAPPAPQQLVDVEGLSLTALIRGTSARPTVWVDERYELDIPAAALDRLTTGNERERLLRAIDNSLPVCCIAVVDESRQKLFELRQLFFPKRTREALGALESEAPASRRVAR
jgi:hypothetical protein